MKDIFESIRLYIFERLTSPLFATFVASWCLWNYRFIMVLISDLKVNEKFSFIDNVLLHKYENTYANSAWNCVHFLIGPAAVTVVFILYYQKISKIFYSVWLRQQVEIKETRDEIEKAIRLTEGEYQKMKKEALAGDKEYFETIDRLEKQITEFKDENKKLRENLSDVQSGYATLRFTNQQLSDTKSDLEKQKDEKIRELASQLNQALKPSITSENREERQKMDDIIKLLSERNGIFPRDEFVRFIKDRLSLTDQAAWYIMGEMKTQNLVREENTLYNGQVNSCYQLTSKAIKYLDNKTGMLNPPVSGTFITSQSGKP
jgi:regulator of replication initiation timing